MTSSYSLNTDVIVVAKIGDYIHGCLVCMGTNYPDFIVLLHMHYEQ